MSEPYEILAGRPVNEAEELAAESALLAEEDEADRVSAPAAGGPEDEDLDTMADPDAILPVEDVDVEEDVEALGEAPDGEEMTEEETADIAQQLEAIREANESLPPDQQIPTSPEEVN